MCGGAGVEEVVGNVVGDRVEEGVGTGRRMSKGGRRRVEEVLGNKSLHNTNKCK